MTLEQFRYFEAIVKHGSFRAAAEALYRSQSSLSISIRKLEEELGVQLFTRDAYRPVLTDAGKAIYEKGCNLLKKERDIKTLASQLASGVEPELRLSISGIVPIEPVIQAINHVTQTFPETRMTLLIENLGGTMERLYDDDADIAITDIFEIDSEFEHNQITEVPFVSVVPSGSVWAEKADILSEQDIENETLIVVRDTSNHSPRISKGLIDGAPQWVVNDFATKQRIMRMGKGWGRMPLHLVRDDLKQQRLTMLNSRHFQMLFAPIHIVRRKNNLKGPAETMLWQALQELDWHKSVSSEI